MHHAQAINIDVLFHRETTYVVEQELRKPWKERSKKRSKERKKSRNKLLLARDFFEICERVVSLLLYCLASSERAAAAAETNQVVEYEDGGLFEPARLQSLSRTNHLASDRSFVFAAARGQFLQIISMSITDW